MVHSRFKMKGLSTMLPCVLLVGGVWACQPRHGMTVGPADGTTSRPSAGRRLSVLVQIASNANNDSPVALSLLLIYDPALTRQLSMLTAVEWFEKREQILDTTRGQVDEVLWEFIPGQEVPHYTRPLRPRRVEGLLFVRYQQGGPHRYFFSPEHPLYIDLKAREVRVEQVP